VSESSVEWQQIMPLLQVGNLLESLKYYTQVLGFAVISLWPDEREPKWAHLARGKTRVMLTFDLGTSDRQFIAEKGNGVVLYVVVEDVYAAYRELEEKGAIIVQELAEFGGQPQFSITEPNGYVLAFVGGWNV